MRLSMIVALAENGVIGRENKLPWFLPGDLKYFKEVTMGKPLIMGRKTFDSIGRPLPGRTNIIITRDGSYKPEGTKVVSSLEAALEMAKAALLLEGGDEIMVIGGAEIYTQFLPKANRLYLTQLHSPIDGDAFFPEINESEWSESTREDFSASGANPHDYSFIVLER